jgi:putative acetyltransferase
VLWDSDGSWGSSSFRMPFRRTQASEVLSNSPILTQVRELHRPGGSQKILSQEILRRFGRKDDAKIAPLMITIEPEDPRSEVVQGLLSAFVEDVKKRYDTPPADVGTFDPNLVSVPRSVFLVARRDKNAIGCGALVPMDDSCVEIKRMYVSPEERGHGIATMILDELERLARDFGYDAMRLETGVNQPESIALYGKAGFYRIPNFPPFVGDASAVCFEKGI